MAQYLGEPLDLPPADGVSQVRFSTTSNFLLVSSWDKTLRLYDATQRVLRGTFNHAAPVLTCCFQDDNYVYSGSLDGAVRRLGFHNREETVMGTHSAAVRCVEFLRERGLVLSGSWDQSLRLWDPRLPPFQNCVATVGLPGKVFTMSTSGDNVVVGTSGRHILVYDVRRLESGPPMQQRESSLKYQTRCIACYPDGRGFALGSVEGRVAMEFIDLAPEVQANKYAFKCHRRQEGGRDVVYPVHCIAYHPTFGTFATGGGDGVVNIWDGDNKKRLFQISRYASSVASLSFSRDGSLLAVAASYAYERGEVDHEPDAIYIRSMQEAEVRPKQRR